MAHLELSFLGRYDVMLDGEPLTGFASDKMRVLLAYLAVEGRRPHRREALAGLLWPDYPDADALVSLRQAVYKLRQALGEGVQSKQAASPPFLLVTPQTVQLYSSSYRLDTEEFSALVDACRSHRHRRIEHCSTCHARFLRAAQLYQGDFLDGFLLQDTEAFDEWLVLKREGLRRQALEVFGSLAMYYEGHTEYKEALQYVYHQLEMEPWREEAHRQAMKLLTRQGERSAAIAQYETCRRVLREEFGIEPEAQTTALYESIKVGDQGSPQGPLSSVANHNLPEQLTPFIGREEELARLNEMLDSPDYRLITLVGLGGVGKTRLALQAAYEQVIAFGDGVHYIPLAAVDRSQLIVSSIAQAVGLRFGGSEQPEAQLVEYLRDREMLLVLDNFEHLLGVGPGTDLLVSILKNAPKMTMLVASREHLGLQAEYLLDVAGLPFPDEVPILNSQAQSYAEETSDLGPDAWNLASYGAVRLFVERAKRVQSGFAVSLDNAQGVLDICKLVEGLPLGIVLAAAWVRHFPTTRIAESIRDNLDFLRSFSRDASVQHSSLRAVFNHSWKLLPEDEQRVLRKLSVFRGGWDEAAAEIVAGAPESCLLSLIDKSLLRRDAAGRFNMHEVVRQYAVEQLRAIPGEHNETQLAHAAYFLDLAEQAENKLWGPQADAWLTVLEREHNNVRAVLEWASSSSSPERSNFPVFQRLSGAVWRFWYLRGHYKEGRDYLLEALSSLQNSDSEPSYAARVYHGAGVLSVVQGDFAAATRFLEKSLQLYRQVGDKARMAFALTAAGVAAHDQGAYARASALYGESLALNREIGDKVGTMLALNNWGNIAREQGDYARAQTLFKESLALAQEIGDKRGTALSLLGIGIATWQRGDYETAASLVQQSLKLHYELGDRLGMSNCLEMLGRVAASEAQAAPSRAQDAAHFWGGAEVLREAIGSPLPPADQADHDGSVTLARETLEVEAFREAWAKGRATPIGQIVAYALEKAR